MLTHMKKKKKTSPKALWIIFGAVVLVGAISVTYAAMQTVRYAPYKVVKMAPAQVAARKARILAIYASLNLPSSYHLVSQNIFGEERQYTYDTGRTMASSRSYIRNATPDATFAELTPLIKAAGFSFWDEPYPNEIDIEYHYKDARGEFLRVMISSKPRDDAIMAAHGNVTATTPDRTGGPSNVAIEVNLNDNND